MINPSAHSIPFSDGPAAVRQYMRNALAIKQSKDEILAACKKGGGKVNSEQVHLPTPDDARYYNCLELVGRLRGGRSLRKILKELILRRQGIRIMAHFDRENILIDYHVRLLRPF